jgi:hypothetical protein
LRTSGICGIRNGEWTLNRARADIGEPPVEGGDEPVLIDRQNLVQWSHMADMSAANIAAKTAKGEVAAPPEHEPPPRPVTGPEPEPPEEEPAPAAPAESHRLLYRRRLREALAALPGGIDERAA